MELLLASWRAQTTRESWSSIQKDGELKASSIVGTASHQEIERGAVYQYMQNEPPEYRDFVMLADASSTAPEVILASWAVGRFVLDDAVPYAPGVRLYFDNQRIIRDGLAVRDGIHDMKVLLALPLPGYLLAALSEADVDPPKGQWTPRSFVDRTNACFHARAGTGERT